MLDTVFCGLLVALELFHSIMTTAVGIPTMEALHQISLRTYDQRSVLSTQVEYLTGGITFVVSVAAIAFVKNSTLHSKVSLFLLPLGGSVLGAAVSVFIYSRRDTVSAHWVRTMYALVSLSGGRFLYETMISDLVAGIVSSTRQRVSMYMLLKGIKLGGLCLVQATPQLATEDFILKWFTLVSAVLMVAHTGMNLVAKLKEAEYVAVEYVAVEDEAEPEALLCQKIYQDNDTGSTGLTAHHVLLAILISLHSAQRGEYKFTYYFLHDRLDFTSDTVRLLNGGQYFLFFVCLTCSGWLMKGINIARASLIAFCISMLLSIAARVCQVVAWNEVRFDIWALSVLLSTPGPIAYQVMQATMYQVLGDGSNAGIVVMAADRFISLPFLFLYQRADQALCISPFYVTLGLMIATAVGGLSTKRMRSWLSG